METILEQQRRYHEERERLMDAMVKEMLHKKSSSIFVCPAGLSQHSIACQITCYLTFKLLQKLSTLYLSVNVQAGKVALRNAQASGLLRVVVAESNLARYRSRRLLATIFHSFPLMTCMCVTSLSVTKHCLAISHTDQPTIVLLFTLSMSALDAVDLKHTAFRTECWSLLWFRVGFLCKNCSAARCAQTAHLHYMDSTNNLKELYEDKDGLRKEEVAALSGPNEFAEFYTRLKGIKDFYRRLPNEISIPMSVEFEELAKLRDNPSDEQANMVEFTDEEGYGKYLDLHECYEKYVNLKGIEKVDYITYLTTFDHLFDIPKDRKNSEYRKYLDVLLDYLHTYLMRVRPLLDLNSELENVQRQFQVQWENGNFPGWPKETGSALTHVGAHLDLSAFSSWEELASLGLDRLKSALMALGLKCGGTLEERAQRLFGTKGKKSLDPSLFAKNKPGKVGRGKESERQREIASLESQVYRFTELLSEQRNATKENVQRKQARTEGERDDSDAEASASESEDEDDTDVPYNPKNLPLGWDGKPIPYWLYKLHGLNISYNCEICGNFTYKGPKAFQRHFAEWRHAHGMRCLGIPNTAHFANVTQIEDALALWEKLKNQKHGERWQPEQEEEYEDSQGNVVSLPVCLITAQWSIFMEFRYAALGSRPYHLTETPFQVVFNLWLMFRKVHLCIAVSSQDWSFPAVAAGQSAS
ncbi:hypothetical protein Cfor_12689 [Coptotermes formosanus]|uniref:Matrin-type domain-containing protein n=1 Tax=Coptotermes formosanus TaxID=36987 RepID=A0A6L2Q6Z2_COPFO|nr:hypothetical protein Cfor_12689 [Coptotermes formosanus]